MNCGTRVLVLRVSTAAAAILAPLIAVPSQLVHVRADGSASTIGQATGCDAPNTSINISTHNSAAFAPGDRIILCAEGGVFREALQPPSSGAPGLPITYDGRGLAVLSASDRVQGWSSEGEDRYTAFVEIQPEQVFVEGEFASRRESLEDLSQRLDWFWQSGTLSIVLPEGNPDVVLSDPGIEASRRDYSVFLNHHDHIVFDGIVARHSQQHGFYLLNDCDSVTIRNSVSEWNYVHGIYKTSIAPHDHGLIEKSVLRNNGAFGVQINGNHRSNTVRQNTIYNNGTYQKQRLQVQNWTGGIKAWGGSIYVSGLTISENLVFGNGPPAATNGQGIGIWLDYCAGSEDRNTIRANFVFGNRNHGIFIEKSSNSDVKNNVVFANSHRTFSAGIALVSGDSAVVEGNSIENNSVWGSSYWGLLCEVYDYGGSPGLSGSTIRNNIVAGSEHEELWVQNACLNDGMHGDGNVFMYNSFGTERTGFIRWGTESISTYTEFDELYGAATHSVPGDPEFADPWFPLLILQDSSACVDAGVDLGGSHSVCLDEDSEWPFGVEYSDQNLHGARWDLGAYCRTGLMHDGLLFFSKFEDFSFGKWSSIQGD